MLFVVAGKKELVCAWFICPMKIWKGVCVRSECTSLDFHPCFPRLAEGSSSLPPSELRHSGPLRQAQECRNVFEQRTIQIVNIARFHCCPHTGYLSSKTELYGGFECRYGLKILRYALELILFCVRPIRSGGGFDGANDAPFPLPLGQRARRGLDPRASLG